MSKQAAPQFRRFGRFALALLVAALLAMSSQAARAAECGAFPTVDWWNITHESVKKYVRAKHDGDWRPYIGKWERQLAKMKDVYARNNSAVSPTGVKLKDERLKGYIDQIGQRIAVTRCLAGETDMGMGDLADLGLGDLAGDQAVTVGPGVFNIKTATFKSKDFDLVISTFCLKNDFVFEVLNVGGAWPDDADFRILSKNGDKTFLARTLRLAKNKKATFKIKPKETDSEAGVRIEPSWAGQYMEFGAAIDCS